MNLLAVDLRSHGFVLKKPTSVYFERDGSFVDILVKSIEESNMKSIIFRIKENPSSPGNPAPKFHFIMSPAGSLLGQNNFNDKETKQLESILNKHCSNLSFDCTLDRIVEALL